MNISLDDTSIKFAPYVFLHDTLSKTIPCHLQDGHQNTMDDLSSGSVSGNVLSVKYVTSFE